MKARLAPEDALRFKMTRMHNPPHPGEVLREYLGEITVTDAASKLGVDRVTWSRVVTGAAAVSPDMAYRLGAAFGTSPELWAGMQMQYDLFQAEKPSAPRLNGWRRSWDHGLWRTKRSVV